MFLFHCLNSNALSNVLVDPQVMIWAVQDTQSLGTHRGPTGDPQGTHRGHFLNVCYSQFVLFISLRILTLHCLKEWGGWAVKAHNPTSDVIRVGCGLSSTFLLSKQTKLEAQVHTVWMKKLRASWDFASKLTQECFNIPQRKDWAHMRSTGISIDHFSRCWFLNFLSMFCHFVTTEIEPNWDCVKRDYVRLAECEWLIKQADDQRLRSWQGC